MIAVTNRYVVECLSAITCSKKKKKNLAKNFQLLTLKMYFNLYYYSKIGNVEFYAIRLGNTDLTIFIFGYDYCKFRKEIDWIIDN